MLADEVARGVALRINERYNVAGNYPRDTHLQVPLDVVLRSETGIKARRFAPFPGTDITVPDDYLDAARVLEPILVIKDPGKHGKPVPRAALKGLINTVELYSPTSFSGAASKEVPKAR